MGGMGGMPAKKKGPPTGRPSSFAAVCCGRLRNRQAPVRQVAVAEARREDVVHALRRLGEVLHPVGPAGARTLAGILAQTALPEAFPDRAGMVAVVVGDIGRENRVAAVDEA